MKESKYVNFRCTLAYSFTWRGLKYYLDILGPTVSTSSFQVHSWHDTNIISTSTIFQTRHWIGTYVISKSLWSGKIKRMTNFCWGHLFRILFTVSNIYIYYYTCNLVILYSTSILYVAVVQIYGIFRQIFGFSYKMYRRLNHYFDRISC